MATYSAFFSSGLLAPRIARCTTPVLPSSPMAISPSPLDPVDRQSSVTPTPHGQTMPCLKASENHNNPEHPKMRRRRSSINVAASPMALIKSPVRNAGVALQRTGLISPTRHRAASTSANEASQNNSLFGRLRSGSIGGIANASRRLRRAIRVPVPIVPPPNVPLPAPPISPTVKCGDSLLPPAILDPLPHHSLTKINPEVGANYSPALLGPNYASNVPIKLSPCLFDMRDDTVDEMMQN